jgi:hypothetical protein
MEELFMPSFPSLDTKCGRYFRYRDFIECGETYQAIHPDNVPKSKKTYSALLELAKEILDPVSDKFGNVSLTYGLSCRELSRHIDKRISPPLDQHASYEVNSKGDLICKRGGAAVDFYSIGHNSLLLAQWVVQNRNFDRLYFYGVDRPIHVSVGPEKSRYIVLMRMSKKPERRTPRKISIENFIALNEDDYLITSCSHYDGEPL